MIKLTENQLKKMIKDAILKEIEHLKNDINKSDRKDVEKTLKNNYREIIELETDGFFSDKTSHRTFKIDLSPTNIQTTLTVLGKHMPNASGNRTQFDYNGTITFVGMAFTPKEPITLEYVKQILEKHYTRVIKQMTGGVFYSKKSSASFDMSMKPTNVQVTIKMLNNAEQSHFRYTGDISFDGVVVLD